MTIVFDEELVAASHDEELTELCNRYGLTLEQLARLDWHLDAGK